MLSNGYNLYGAQWTYRAYKPKNMGSIIAHNRRGNHKLIRINQILMSLYLVMWGWEAGTKEEN
jgi:hypothetical protein